MGRILLYVSLREGGEEGRERERACKINLLDYITWKCYFIVATTTEHL